MKGMSYRININIHIRIFMLCLIFSYQLLVIFIKCKQHTKKRAGKKGNRRKKRKKKIRRKKEKRVYKKYVQQNIIINVNIFDCVKNGTLNPI